MRCANVLIASVGGWAISVDVVGFAAEFDKLDGQVCADVRADCVFAGGEHVVGDTSRRHVIANTR
jgi:hypothetical protein